MDFNGYEIVITNMTLPKLPAPWTRVDTTNGSFWFKRSTDTSMSFSVSGFISLNSYAETKEEAEGLNADLSVNPSGTLTDGFGTTYTVVVDDYEIAPVAGINKYTFTMQLRILGEN
jgi:hypothetical protein